LYVRYVMKSSVSYRTWVIGAVLWGFAPMVVVCVPGCSSPAPRYRSDTASSTVHPEDDEFRFASKIREEETREDDRKVDLTKATKDLTSKARSSKYKNFAPQEINRDQVLLDVVSYLGVPYSFGGTSRKGIDCSGFTSSVYARAASRDLPRSTREQFRVGMKVSANDLRFGDLVFFNTTGRSPSHVGIYIEDDLFAHASVTYGVTLSSLESTYYRNRFIGARRIVQ